MALRSPSERRSHETDSEVKNIRRDHGGPSGIQPGIASPVDRFRDGSAAHPGLRGFRRNILRMRIRAPHRMSTAFLPVGACRACDHASDCLERDRGLPCRNFTNEYERRKKKRDVSEAGRKRGGSGEPNRKHTGSKRKRNELSTDRNDNSQQKRMGRDDPCK